MKKSANIFISEVNLIKSGFKDGRHWSMYNVIDENANKYTTFSDRYVSLQGTRQDIEFEEAQVPGKKEGQVFTNRTIIENPASKEMVESLRAKAKGISTAKEDREFDKQFDKQLVKESLPHDQKELHDKLDEILRIVRALYENTQPPF